MRIQLPTKKGTPNSTPEIEFEQLVIIGANGAGKTRFGTEIEAKRLNTTHRISAQKSLTLPSEVSPTSRKKAELTFQFGTYYDNYNAVNYTQNKFHHRYGGKPNTTMLNDFDHLLVLLHTDEYEAALNYKEGRSALPVTRMDRVQQIWETVLPHRKLLKSAGTIETFPTDSPANKYNASEMSDGERVIFYLAGEVVCAPENSLIIIDEPEMHLHKSLIKTLFDLIETERRDCSLIYLTHDIDFAFTRQNAKKIWVKSYEGNNVWDYEILDELMPIPEQLYLEVLGSRRPILFIEGDNSSIDYEIYEQVYTNYTLKPLGGCEKVIQTVSAFNAQNAFHHIQAYGIIDRDRRQDGDIIGLNRRNIWVLNVAEAENLLLIEEIVRAISIHMGVDPDAIFTTVRANIINFFTRELDNQVLIHFKELFRRKCLELANFATRTIADTIVEIDSTFAAINKQQLYDDVRAEFEEVARVQDYDRTLKLFNLKNALIPQSAICELTGVRNKEEFRRLTITLLKKRDAASMQIKAGMERMIIKTTP